MAHSLFSTFAYYWDFKEHAPWKTALSCFLIAEVCVGLPVLVWTLRVFYRCYKSGGQVSAFMIMLLFCDLLVLLLNPYIVTKLFQGGDCWRESTACRIFSCLWSASSFCALHLQPVVALERALSLRHSLCSAHFFFPSSSIMISIIMYAFFFFCELFGPVLVFLGLPLSLALTALSCIVTCRAPPNINNIPYRTLKASRLVLAFVLFTEILYVTLIIVFLLTLYGNVTKVFFIMMSLRVTTDPLMCVLAYRKDLWVQSPQTPAEPNANIELVKIQGLDTHTAQSV